MSYVFGGISGTPCAEHLAGVMLHDWHEFCLLFVDRAVVKSIDSRTRLHELGSWPFYFVALLDLIVPAPQGCCKEIQSLEQYLGKY